MVFVAFAGARRTDSAFPQLLRWSPPADMLVAPEGSGLGSYDTAVGRLPEVEGSRACRRDSGVAHLSRRKARRECHGRRSPQGDLLLRAFDRPKIVAGRLPGHNQPGEVAIDVIRRQTPPFGPGKRAQSGCRRNEGSPTHFADSPNGSSAWSSHEKTSCPLRIQINSDSFYATPALLYGLGPDWRQYQSIRWYLREVEGG